MKFFNIDLTNDLTNIGTIKVNELEKYILDEERRKEPRSVRGLSFASKTRDGDEKIIKIIDNVIAKFESKRTDESAAISPDEVDWRLDKDYWKLSLRLAKKIKNNFILDFVKRQVDVMNIRSLIRIKSLGKDIKFLKTMLIPGGKIEQSELIEYLEKDLDELINYLHGYLLGEQERFLKDYADKKFLWQLEKGFNDLEMDYIKRTKWMSYGPEIIFGY